MQMMHTYIFLSLAPNPSDFLSALCSPPEKKKNKNHDLTQ